jgi:hypothetical protein
MPQANPSRALRPPTLAPWHGRAIEALRRVRERVRGKFSQGPFFLYAPFKLRRSYAKQGAHFPLKENPKGWGETKSCKRNAPYYVDAWRQVCFTSLLAPPYSRFALITIGAIAPNGMCGLCPRLFALLLRSSVAP